MKYDPDQPLSTKELADALGFSRRYVTYMKQRGFTMPGGKATFNEARAWQARNPPPCSRKTFRPAA
jgi:hypothetical protein